MENIAVPSREDVPNARQALRRAFLEGTDIVFSCNVMEFKPLLNTLTFQTITYVYVHQDRSFTATFSFVVR